MAVTRRELLVKSGMGALSTSFLSMQSPWAVAAENQDEWELIRRQFPLDPNRIHLTGLLLASHPKPVAEAIEFYRRALDANPAEFYHDHGHDLAEKVRAQAASFLKVRPSEVALTDSTTMGLGLLYGGIKLDTDQEILTSNHDHFSTHESLALRAARTGARYRKISLFNNSSTASQTEIVTRLERAIKPSTRVVALTWVHSSTGLKLPVRAVADAIATLNRSRDDGDRIILCIDGVHGFGVEDFSLPELGCDFFAAGCHKWIFGPRGTGLLWGRSELSSHVEPMFPNFGDSETWGQRMSPGGFHSFEHRWALGKAFEFHLSIGRKKIVERIHQLNSQLKEGLMKIKGVTLHTPLKPELSAGLVCFEIAGVSPPEVVSRLAKKNIIASTTPYDVSYARLTPGLLNNPKEIDVALGTIYSIAKGV